VQALISAGYNDTMFLGGSSTAMAGVNLVIGVMLRLGIVVVEWL
jgi:hypothetical protein